jgi:hypothetical protein
MQGLDRSLLSIMNEKFSAIGIQRRLYTVIDLLWISLIIRLSNGVRQDVILPFSI